VIGVVESLTLAPKATIPSKGFLLLGAHTLIAIILYNTVYSIYFSPSTVKNEPGEGVAKHAFILGPISMVANNIFEFVSLQAQKP
jgi:hypothetical protein